MPFTVESARNIFPSTLTADAVPATTARLNPLRPEEQLALIWFAYFEMGRSYVSRLSSDLFQWFPIYKCVVPMFFCLGTEGSNGSLFRNGWFQCFPV